jgi:hypothetical protein
MPAVDSRNVIPAKKRVKRHAPAPATPTPDQADRTRAARQPPQTPRPTPITAPIAQRPFQAQRQRAQRSVDVSRRRLPQVPVAAPPVIPSPTRAQTQAQREQVVSSVRRATAGLRGAERVEAQARLMREVRTDPRYRRTAGAIRNITAWEQSRARPQTSAELRAGPPHRRAGVGFATVDLTVAGQALGSRFAQATPGLHVKDASGRFVSNAFRDVGTLATAPFVGAVGLGRVGVDLATGHPDRAYGRARDFVTGAARGTIEDWSHPGRYLVEHPTPRARPRWWAGALARSRAARARRWTRRASGARWRARARRRARRSRWWMTRRRWRAATMRSAVSRRT